MVKIGITPKGEETFRIIGEIFRITEETFRIIGEIFKVEEIFRIAEETTRIMETNIVLILMIMV